MAPYQRGDAVFLDRCAHLQRACTHNEMQSPEVESYRTRVIVPRIGLRNIERLASIGYCTLHYSRVEYSAVQCSAVQCSTSREEAIHEPGITLTSLTR